MISIPFRQIDNIFFTTYLMFHFCQIDDLGKVKQSKVIQDAIFKFRDGTRFRVPDDKFGISHMRLIEDLGGDFDEEGELKVKPKIEKKKNAKLVGKNVLHY